MASTSSLRYLRVFCFDCNQRGPAGCGRRPYSLGSPCTSEVVQLLGPMDLGSLFQFASPEFDAKNWRKIIEKVLRNDRSFLGNIQDFVGHLMFLVYFSMWMWSTSPVSSEVHLLDKSLLGFYPTNAVQHLNIKCRKLPPIDIPRIKGLESLCWDVHLSHLILFLLWKGFMLTHLLYSHQRRHHVQHDPPSSPMIWITVFSSSFHWHQWEKSRRQNSWAFLSVDRLASQRKYIHWLCLAM